MKRLVPCATVVALLMPLPCGSATAQEDAKSAAFVRDLVAAINSKSIDRRKTLMHPKSLACATPGAAAMTNQMLTRQSRRTIPANYKWTMTPVANGEPLMFAEHFDYPVRPTHLLQIDYETAPNRGVTMILQVVHEGNKWREVTGCPKPETVSAAEDASKARVAAEGRARELAAGMPQATRNEVTRLLKEGRRIDAIRAYQKASGEDLTMSKQVVDIIESANPR